jgi:hypothetical protein
MSYYPLWIPIVLLRLILIKTPSHKSGVFLFYIYSYTYQMKNFFIKYRKPIVVILSISILQLIFGFDPKFCLINIIWLFV